MAFIVKISLLLAAVATASAAPQLLVHSPVPVVHHTVPVATHVPVVHAAVSSVVPINSQSFDLSHDNSYSFHYESADGSARQEIGQARAPLGSGAYGGVAVQGSYVHGTPEGIPVQVQYVADEFGYQPSGPNVHPEIQKAVAEQVAFARANPEPLVAVHHVAHVPVVHSAVPVVSVSSPATAGVSVIHH